MKKLTLSLFAFCLSTSALYAQGNAKAGKKIFKKCKTCHSVEEAKHKNGPSLYKIIGAQAGKVEGYKYSSGFKNVDIIWDRETLPAYIKDPKALIKGTRMTAVKLKKDTDIDDLIAYLEEKSE